MSDGDGWPDEITICGIRAEREEGSPLWSGEKDGIEVNVQLIAFTSDFYATVSRRDDKKRLHWCCEGPSSGDPEEAARLLHALLADLATRTTAGGAA